MIHFKVIRASRLLLWLAIIALVVVIGLIALNGALNAAPKTSLAAVRLVDSLDGEAKAQTAFALSGALATASKPDTGSSAVALCKSVLIYHTHTHEAYEQVESDPYEAVEAWRTTDDSHSVVRVGDALAGQLRALGFEVVHDISDNEADDLPTAYTRSLAMLNGYDRPFDLYIDLHRDAYVDGTPMCATAPDGTSCAQTMLLIGNGNGFEEKPFYRQNLAFARALTDRVNKFCPGLCKAVLVKDGRYNQHIGVFSVLIEVGHNRNTLQEALNSTPYLAKAICDLMVDDPDPTLEVLSAWATNHMNSIETDQK